MSTIRNNVCEYKGLINISRMIYSKSFYILFFGLILILSSCKPEEINPPEENHFTIQLYHNMNNKPLLGEALDYRNEAGETFSVNKMEYYLSNFTFNENSNFSDSTAFYINSFKTNTHHININLEQNIKSQTIQSIHFNLGLAEKQNISSFLPNITENINMAWPDQMGGGYHFLKMEGNFLLSADTLGYAIHIGTNEHLIEINLNNLSIDMNRNDTIKMNVDISEIFKNPEIYSLKIGQHTMYSDSLMQIIKNNAWNVFALSQ
ncbi:MbnP family protein [Marivirga sp.]|uniref:MbnP family protein n=1 Tax=Marivirga sp. TaxID=2018662 RepID=UPI0025FC19F0|nr:MbnP family protein [Marivirga sp.]